MTARLFDSEIRIERDAVIIDLQGEINAFAEEALNSAYSEAASQGRSNTLLNFKDVDYINSTGIALIVGLMTQARKSNIRLLAYGLSSHYAEIFRVTRLDDFIAVFPDEQSALADTKKRTED